MYMCIYRRLCTSREIVAQQCVSLTSSTKYKNDERNSTKNKIKQMDDETFPKEICSHPQNNNYLLLKEQREHL